MTKLNAIREIDNRMERYLAKPLAYFTTPKSAESVFIELDSLRQTLVHSRSCTYSPELYEFGRTQGLGSMPFLARYLEARTGHAESEEDTFDALVDFWRRYLVERESLSLRVTDGVVVPPFK